MDKTLYLVMETLLQKSPPDDPVFQFLDKKRNRKIDANLKQKRRGSPLLKAVTVYDKVLRVRQFGAGNMVR